VPVFVGPAGGQGLQGGQRLLEFLLRRAVLADVLRIGQHQVAAQVQLHAQQRLLRLGRGQRGRCADGLADFDVARRVPAGDEGQRHHEQREADEEPEADRQLAADADAPAHAAKRGARKAGQAHAREPFRSRSEAE
jgi:hypothetical protein